MAAHIKGQETLQIASRMRENPRQFFIGEGHLNERIFNLFLFISDGIIRELGGSSHEVDGSDEEKFLFLQRHVETDVTQLAGSRFPIGTASSVSVVASRLPLGCATRCFRNSRRRVDTLNCLTTCSRL